MDSTVKNPSILHNRTMIDFLPGLIGILSEEGIQSLNEKKRIKESVVQSRTAEKLVKPMSTAEMRAHLLALRTQSPKFAQPSASGKKRNWNSSVKVDKTKSHTADGQMKHNSVRKVLNFQAKTKPIIKINAETPKFPKPEIRPKKALQSEYKNNVRISGICKIPETPLIINKPIKNRMTLQQQINKENNSYVANLNKKMPLPKPSKPFVPKKLMVPKPETPKPETPLSNMSFKSNCDDSFLEKEKEINSLEQIINAVTEESTLERIAEVSPPVSTPFKEYRNVMEYFNQTSECDSLNTCNDTIMCFEKLSTNNENKRDESVIVSLCDLLSKAAVTTPDDKKPTTELNDLLEVEKQTENNIKMLENGIKTLICIRESHMKSLQSVRRLINEKRSKKVSEKENNTTLIQVRSEPVEEITPEKSPTLIRSSARKSKSQSYKIPKKNMCLRKKVFYKSMPNVSDEMQTPKKSDKALSMYMEMKGKMNFLSTPLLKRNDEPPNTPAVMSHNLQKQLDKLYNGS